MASIMPHQVGLRLKPVVGVADVTHVHQSPVHVPL